MIWVPIGVWIGGAVLAVVVLGFSAYELTWKARRLRADLVKLASLSERLTQLQSQIGAAQDRVSVPGPELS